MKLYRKLTTGFLFIVSFLIVSTSAYAADSSLVEPNHVNSSSNIDELTQINRPSAPSNEVTIGQYGKFTKNAVRAFQKKQQLQVNGIADASTLDHLGLSKSVHTPTLKPGDEGLDIILLQEKLVELGDLQGHFLNSQVKTAERTTLTKAQTRIIRHLPKEKKVTVKATAYTPNCKGCSGITKTGLNLHKHPHKKVIAVDPRLIPLGSTVYVPGYGKATAEDTGGAINGKHIDVLLPTKKAAEKWGVQELTITVVKKN